MISTLIEKELKSILLSPKFIAVFSVCSILILLSIYIGIEDYRVSMAHYEVVTAQADQQMQEETSWQGVSPVINRYPDPMQIFVAGVQNDIGRQATIGSRGTIKLSRSHYSQNILFAFFRSMDLMFIVKIVLSLFAILFTYDAVNGERETGTLKLSFSNAVPRGSYIIAKLIGSWLGLVIPLVVPLLIGIALVLVYRIPMTALHWEKLGLLIGLSFLYFSFFICLGVLMSSLTRQSSAAFLYLLVIWVALVLIVPRSGVMMAGQFISVPTSAEISARLAQKTDEFSAQYAKKIDEFSAEDTRKIREIYSDKSLTKEEQKVKRDELSEQYRKNINEARDEYNRKIADYDKSLNEDWRNRKAVREKYGFSISRFSPASAFQLAAMDLAETNLKLKTSYEDQLRIYSDIFNKFRSGKEAETDTSFDIMDDKKPEKLDVSDVPKFKYVNADLGSVLQSTVLDMAIIAVFTILAVAGSFVAFTRYDVR